MKVIGFPWRRVWGRGPEVWGRPGEGFSSDSGLRTRGSLEEAIYIVVRDLREERFLGLLVLRGEARDLVEDHGEFARSLLDAQLDQAEAGAFVEDDDQQHATDDADVYALALALVRERRELFLADEPRHAARGGHVPGGQRGQAGRVEVADVALRGDLLAVFVHEKDHTGERFEAQLVENVPELLKLLLVHDDRCVCHSYTGSFSRRMRTVRRVFRGRGFRRIRRRTK